VAPKLSHHSVVTVEEGTQSSVNNEQIHKISAVPSAKALYSASVEDLATVRCFLDFHEIGVEQIHKIFWTEILSSASAKFDISSVFAIILVFRLPFSFCNLVFAFSFCKFVFCFPLLLHSGSL